MGFSPGVCICPLAPELIVDEHLLASLLQSNVAVYLALDYTWLPKPVTIEFSYWSNSIAAIMGTEPLAFFCKTSSSASPLLLNLHWSSLSLYLKSFQPCWLLLLPSWDSITLEDKIIPFPTHCALLPKNRQFFILYIIFHIICTMTNLPLFQITCFPFWFSCFEPVCFEFIICVILLVLIFILCWSFYWSLILMSCFLECHILCTVLPLAKYF